MTTYDEDDEPKGSFDLFEEQRIALDGNICLQQPSLGSSWFGPLLIAIGIAVSGWFQMQAGITNTRFIVEYNERQMAEQLQHLQRERPFQGSASSSSGYTKSSSRSSPST